jgi:hypothetical protein
MSEQKFRRGVNRFNQREVSRALRAVRKSGTPVDRIEIDPTTGKIAVILAKPGGAGTTDSNEWDEDGDTPTKAR